MENKAKVKAVLKQMQSVIALVIIFVVASTICVKDGRNNFLDIRNLMNVLRAVSENGIIAIGMTLILILGDIDLSVGSVVGLISTGCAYLMVMSGFGFIPAVLTSLVIGGLFGLFNGLCITKLHL
ncbi:MAG: ABC transporter permease [Blautia sp.]